jgi:tetratricopeptide (TPR) repeat protein
MIALAAGLKAQTSSDSKKRLAWELGSALSLAGVVFAESSDTALIGRQYARASSAAAALGLKLPPLPVKKGDRVEDSASALAYLLGSTGGPIGKILQQRYGPEHAAIFEIALKSNILLMLYGPGEAESNAIAGVIRKRQVTANLPDVMTRQLLALIDRRASYDEVKKEIFTVHEFAPTFIAVLEYSENGGRFYSNKDYAGSAAEFTKAIAIDPTGPEYYFSRARAYLQLGKNNEAIADYSKVIQLQSSSSTVAKNLPQVYHNRGLGYSLVAKNSLAIADLNMAIKLRPDYASAYKVRGLVHKKMGNLKLGNADLATAEKLQPGITK